MAATNELLLMAMLPEALSQTIIVLIPKKRVVESLGDYQPISLCTMVYKIFAKLICNRLATLLPKLVSLNQGPLFGAVNLRQHLPHPRNFEGDRQAGATQYGYGIGPAQGV